MPARSALPVIGIPQCLDASGRFRAGREYLYADRAYSGAIARAGGLAVHLPVQGESAAVALVDRIDGLLVPGGDDFVPPAGPGPALAAGGPPPAASDPHGTAAAAPTRSYPEHVRFEPTPPEQIAFDAALLEAALAADKPVLGICYGMQLFAVHLGGTLHYHLPLDLPSCQEHRPQDEDARHAIEIEAGTRLAEIVGALDSNVNSRHHQAVADPGPALRTSARAADGVIEAIEGRDTSWLLGVQWHPEKLAGAAGDGLIGAFVRTAARQRSQRSGG